ncbi:MAG: 50S ribosomal protein L9 [Chitinophagaceae bacterium]|nr:50S ribosomal protein L9 [Chitinophagaceae bacterium]
MQVILVQDVNNLGGAHEMVTVKDGYGRNYLIPQGMAVEANKSNLARLKEHQKQQEKKEAKLLAEINEVKSALQGSPLHIGAKTGTTGKIFGRVTAVQISRAIHEQRGYEIDRRKISFPEEVKVLGSYKAHIDFGNGHDFDVDFEVVAE